MLRRSHFRILSDNFFDPGPGRSSADGISKTGQIKWQTFDKRTGNQAASASESSFGSVTRLLLYHLNSITVPGIPQ